MVSLHGPICWGSGLVLGDAPRCCLICWDLCWELPHGVTLGSHLLGDRTCAGQCPLVSPPWPHLLGDRDNALMCWTMSHDVTPICWERGPVLGDTPRCHPLGHHLLGDRQGPYGVTPPLPLKPHLQGDGDLCWEMPCGVIPLGWVIGSCSEMPHDLNCWESPHGVTPDGPHLLEVRQMFWEMPIASPLLGHFPSYKKYEPPWLPF